MCGRGAPPLHPPRPSFNAPLAVFRRGWRKARRCRCRRARSPRAAIISSAHGGFRRLRPLATVLVFRLDDGEQRAELLACELFGHVDLASSERLVPWRSDDLTFCRDLQVFADVPLRLRRERLQQALAKRFAGSERWFAPPAEELNVWTSIIGPARCEACGAVRRRVLWTSLSPIRSTERRCSVMGLAGGCLRPGTRAGGGVVPSARSGPRAQVPRPTYRARSPGCG